MARSFCPSALPIAAVSWVLSGGLIEPTQLTAQQPEENREVAPLAHLLSSYTLIDLTHPFDERTIYWPTETGFQLIRGPAGITEKGYYYAANRFAAPEHGGTHIDAPVHFYQGGQTVDQVPLSHLVGEAAVVDVRPQAEQQPDYQITVSDLRRWEEQHHRLLVDVVVLLRTGYARHWGDRRHYLGTEKTGREALSELHFPGLHPSAAQWLVENRSIKAVGIDTASIDYGQSQLFESHVTLFRRNIPVLENVADMSQLPTAGAIVVALPMKIAGGSGGPVRIIAWVPKPPAGAGSPRP